MANILKMWMIKINLGSYRQYNNGFMKKEIINDKSDLNSEETGISKSHFKKSFFLNQVLNVMQCQ